MKIRWALTSLLAMTLVSSHAQAAMPALASHRQPGAVQLVNETNKPKPVYRKSAPRGATYQGSPCSQTRKTGYVMYNGCWYPREVIRNGRLVVPQGN